MRLPMHVLSHVVLQPSLVARLILILIGLVVDDVEELELVDALGGRDHAEPVTELLLLEELLGPAQTKG